MIPQREVSDPIDTIDDLLFWHASEDGDLEKIYLMLSNPTVQELMPRSLWQDMLTRVQDALARR